MMSAVRKRVYVSIPPVLGPLVVSVADADADADADAAADSWLALTSVRIRVYICEHLYGKHKFSRNFVTFLLTNFHSKSCTT